MFMFILNRKIYINYGKGKTYNEMDILEVFIKRMDKLGIKIELVGNYPWIYIDKINGEKVKEKFQGNHGFTIAFLPIKKDQEIH